MKRQLLSGNGKRVLISLLICCVWVCALPAAARAQPQFSSVVCSVQTVKNFKTVNLQIKCTGQVTGLDPQNASTTITYQFQTSNDPSKGYSDMGQSGVIFTTAVNGTANFDSGWITFDTNGPPNKGQSFRVGVTGTYIDKNGDRQEIKGTTSAWVTPNP